MNQVSVPIYNLLDITNIHDNERRYRAIDADGKVVAEGTRAEIEAKIGVTLPVGLLQSAPSVDPGPAAKYMPGMWFSRDTVIFSSVIAIF